MGARLRWAAATIWTIRASSVSAPTFSAFMTRVPLAFTVAPTTLSPACFSTGIGSPEIMDSSMLLAPSSTIAVHGHLLAGPNPQPVADLHLFERDVGLLAVIEHLPGGLGREPEQSLDRGARPAARPQFQDLAEQDQRDDHRRRLEIAGHQALGSAHGNREETRREECHEAVENRPP